MVTISDVAKHAQVSPAVVSRVLNEDPSLRIGVETRARVLSAVDELNYVPRHAARSLRMHLPSVLSLVLPDATSAIHSELIRGVESAALERNLATNVLRAEHIVSEPDWLPRFVREGRTDGLLLQVTDLAQEGVYAELAELGVPLVLLNSVDTGPLTTIVYDDRAGIRTGMMPFIERGTAASASSAARRSPARPAAAGPPSRRSPQNTTSTCGRNGRLTSGSPPRTVAGRVGDPRSAGPTLRRLHRQRELRDGIHRGGSPDGCDLPDDLSMIALHEVPYAEATWPPLTTVELPNAVLGATAVSCSSRPVGDPAHHGHRPGPAAASAGVGGRAA